MKAQLKRIIADFHQAPLPDYQRRSLDVPLDLGKIVILVGPRRAGKTFYLFQLMDVLERSGFARQQMLYINFEDERLDLTGGNDLIFDAFRELYPDQDLSGAYLFLVHPVKAYLVS